MKGRERDRERRDTAQCTLQRVTLRTYITQYFNQPPPARENKHERACDALHRLTFSNPCVFLVILPVVFRPSGSVLNAGL